MVYHYIIDTLWERGVVARPTGVYFIIWSGIDFWGDGAGSFVL